MRYIKKGEEPKEFTDWKNSPPKKTYESFSDQYDPNMGKLRMLVRKSLMQEQGYICCYCESGIGKKNSHTEHLLPKSKYPDKELDYDNLLCSCIRLGLTKKEAKMPLEERRPIHCGHSKVWKYLPVHPLQEDCQSKFKYDGSGKISGVSIEAKQAIKILNLNEANLKNNRGKAIEVFMDSQISNEENITFAREYIKKKKNKFNPFISAIEYLFVAPHK